MTTDTTKARSMDKTRSQQDKMTAIQAAEPLTTDQQRLLLDLIGTSDELRDAKVIVDLSEQRIIDLVREGQALGLSVDVLTETVAKTLLPRADFDALVATADNET